jgi:hypothetical protein
LAPPLLKEMTNVVDSVSGFLKTSRTVSQTKMKPAKL